MSENSYRVFHSHRALIRKKIHFVLVRPEISANVGAIARCLENMNLEGFWYVVGAPKIIDQSSYNLAKHAKNRLDQIKFEPTLESALARFDSERRLVLAASARVGSAGRPHPIWVREAIAEASRKLCENDVDHLIYVFGPESDGLTNAEVGLCDWVVTIPSSLSYRSLNLAQACMIFAYETQLNLLKPPEEFKSVRPSERAKLISHLIVLAETVGFILPSDPYKMKPRLERILSRLPNHIDGIKTLHGFIDQVVRSVRKGSVDYKGRFLRKVETMEEHNGK